MTDPTKTPPPDAGNKPPAPLSAAAAAKAVKRPVWVPGKDGAPGAFKLVAVQASEVLSFKDYGTHVVVVTNDGQKFSSADLAAEAA